LNGARDKLAVVSDILKVIYAPHKAFKQILQNPKYLGVLVLLVIFVAVQVGSSYVIASKSYLEQTIPTGVEGDVWTENAASWQANSGVTISNNTIDYINSTALYLGGPSFFGSGSVEFAASNTSVVRMELISLNADEQVNSESFKNLSFRLKIVSPNSGLSNVSLFLSSLNASSFHYDLTEIFSSNTTDSWNNLTVPLGSGAWSSSGSDATWENITGLKMEFVWATSSNIDMRLDGLFFRGNYDTPINLYGTETYLAQAAINGIAPFVFEWIVLTAVLFIVIKVLKGNATWKSIMVAVGFALIVLVIQSVVLLAVYGSLPNLFYPLELLANVPGERSIAPVATLEAIDSANLLSSIVQVVVWLWLAGLGTFITHEATGLKADVPPFGWLKSIAVSGVSLLLTILIVGFLLGI
jgi:hypothetical protein